MRGAAAGAAGTTALNAVTYLDMAVRARPASDIPQRAVAKLAEDAGLDIPGKAEDEKDRRLAGLGPLAGIATGVGIGAAAGFLSPVIGRLPTVVGGPLLGAAAMAGSDLPLSKLGLTDPSTWTTTDWLSDIVPHLAYGLVTFSLVKRR